MDKRELTIRIILFAILALGAMALSQYLGNKYLPKPAPAATTQSSAAGDTHTSHTQLAEAMTSGTQAQLHAGKPGEPTAAATHSTPSIPRSAAPRVRLTTKIFDIEFSRRGGVPVRWDMIDPRYAQPVRDANGKLVGGSEARDPLIDPRLVSIPGVSLPLEVILYEANSRYYNEFNDGLYTAQGPTLEGGKTGWRFTSEPNASGVRLVKTYTFDSESYLCHLRLELVNAGTQNLRFEKDDAGLGLQLGPGAGIELPPTNAMARYARTDVALNNGSTLMMPDISKPTETAFIPQSTYEWGAVQGLYFTQAIIPSGANIFTSGKAYFDQDLNNAPETTSSTLPAAEATPAHMLAFFPSVELYGKPFALAAGETKTFTYDVYMGPNQKQRLAEGGHDLQRLMFHTSWFWMRGLALLLMAMLRWFHLAVGNWGVSILLLTFTVRLLVFPLVGKGMKEQAKGAAEINRIKPLMDKLNERYKDDPMRKQQEMMKLYKEHGVNPLAPMKGCFWMLFQIPIFFALYTLLSHSIELRGAHFLWVSDLSQPDKLFNFGTALPLIGTHFNLLPIIVAITQMLSSKFMSQPPTDAQQAQMQKTMLYMTPAMMLFFTYSFPAGLMLYWLVSNVWQVAQQLYVNKHIRPAAQRAANKGIAPPGPTPGTSSAERVKK